MHTNIDVGVLVSRAVDDDRTNRTTRVLAGVVSMVPSSSIKLGPESVSHARAGSNGALSDTRHTVHVVRSSLQEAVPVHARSLVFEIVGDPDLDRIAVISLKEGSRVLAVDANCPLGLDTIGPDVAFCDGEVVVSDTASVGAGFVRVCVGGRDIVPRNRCTGTVIRRSEWVENQFVIEGQWGRVCANHSQGFHLRCTIRGRPVLLIRSQTSGLSCCKAFPGKLVHEAGPDVLTATGSRCRRSCLRRRRDRVEALCRSDAFSPPRLDNLAWRREQTTHRKPLDRSWDNFRRRRYDVEVTLNGTAHGKALIVR
jgi:hypothetical protein